MVLILTNGVSAHIPNLGYVKSLPEVTDVRIDALARYINTTVKLEAIPLAKVELSKGEQPEIPKPVVINVVPHVSPGAVVSTKSYVDNNSVKEYVRGRAASLYGWSGTQWDALEWVVMNESGWDPNAVNRSSGACSLFQALPCSKIGSLEISNQTSWGLNYIKQRYGSPEQAKIFWNLHHWY